MVSTAFHISLDLSIKFTDLKWMVTGQSCDYLVLYDVGDVLT